mmetsp:Transcript_10295/g.15311  ORF Transcript_10295/g.15311 Transcript_10295/m.15311 type:complete len:96 (+) Transcript_10295:226-513(+)
MLKIYVLACEKINACLACCPLIVSRRYSVPFSFSLVIIGCAGAEVSFKEKIFSPFLQTINTRQILRLLNLMQNNHANPKNNLANKGSLTHYQMFL